jgi:hypothetical protein
MSAYAGHVSANSVPNFSNQDMERRPIRPLPTDRVSPINQLNVLRAWVTASLEGTRAVTVNEVAKIVQMAASTVAMTNPFFSSIGLIQRLAVGTYMPSAEVIAFSRNGPDTLGKVFQSAWFYQVLLPGLTRAPMEEDQAASLLAEGSNASSEHKKAIGFLLDLMVLTDMIERTGGEVKLISKDGLSPTNSLFLGEGSDGCRIRVNIDSKDLATWSADQITAFFNGLTQLAVATKDQAE